MAKYLGAYLLNAIGGEGTDEASLKKTLESAGIEVDSAMVRYFFLKFNRVVFVLKHP